jgi:MarR family 2-MHQ and catechol resistance regulon transcriptional repressor
MTKRDPDTINSEQAGAAELAFRELWRVIGKLKRIAEPRFARFGISPAQWGILRCIQRFEVDGREPPRVTDLSENLLVKPPSVSAVVDRLERMDLVARGPTSDDQRSRRVRLTENGRRLVEQVLAGHADWIRMLMAGLNGTEQTELLRMLKKLGVHLEPLVQGAGACADESVVEAKRRRSRR